MLSQVLHMTETSIAIRAAVWTALFIQWESMNPKIKSRNSYIVIFIPECSFRRSLPHMFSISGRFVETMTTVVALVHLFAGMHPTMFVQRGLP